MCVHAQLCPTLRDPTDCSPSGYSDHGILQARILEWVAMPSSRGSSQPRDWTHVSHVSCIGRWILYQNWRLSILSHFWVSHPFTVSTLVSNWTCSISEVHPYFQIKSHSEVPCGNPIPTRAAEMGDPEDFRAHRQCPKSMWSPSITVTS